MNIVLMYMLLFSILSVKQVPLPASLVKASTTKDITPPPQVNNVQAEEKPAQTKDNKNEGKAAKKGS